jgi:hypothetical protein
MTDHDNDYDSRWDFERIGIVQCEICGTPLNSDYEPCVRTPTGIQCSTCYALCPHNLTKCVQKLAQKVLPGIPALYEIQCEECGKTLTEEELQICFNFKK